MSKRLRGQTALVTGASAGIGLALAREFASEGAGLVLVSRDLAKLNREAENLKTRYGVSVRVFATDLILPGACEKLFRDVEDARLTVDILVNNAGFGHYGEFTEHPTRTITDMLALNIGALVTLTRLFLPGMRERRKGGILNVASIAGFQALPYLSLYAASKAFVIDFSEALWVENLEYGLRVFCLCPGNTRTAFHQIAGIEKRKAFFNAEASDVARFAVRKFLRGRRPVGIFGFWNKLMIHAERLAPRVIVLFFTDLLYRPRETKKVA